jgi:hypothetical protein
MTGPRNPPFHGAEHRPARPDLVMFLTYFGLGITLEDFIKSRKGGWYPDYPQGTVQVSMV